MSYCVPHVAPRSHALRDRKVRDSHTQTALGGAATAAVTNLIHPLLGARMAPHSVPVRTATNTSTLPVDALGYELLGSLLSLAFQGVIHEARTH